MWCALSQWYASREADTGQPPPAWAARHLTRCPHCRAPLEHQRGLEAALRREAPAALARTPLPESLHRRIMQAVRAEAAAPRPAAQPSAAARWWLAAAAGVVVAVAFGLWAAHHRPPPAGPPAPGPAIVAAPRPAASPPARAFAVVDRQVQLATEGPYQQELVRLRHDVERAQTYVLGAFR